MPPSDAPSATRSHRASLVPLTFALAMAGSGVACADYRYAFYEGPPTTKQVSMPPPSDFAVCRDQARRHQLVDADGDGRTDAVRVVSNNDDVEVCHGSDTNNDGQIDTWDIVENGRITKRAHDSDNNGKVDQIWTWPNPSQPACALVTSDKDGDGKGDGKSLDLCAALGAKADTPPPLAPLATPASASPTPAQ